MRSIRRLLGFGAASAFALSVSALALADDAKPASPLDLRESLTLESHVTFLEGELAPGGPYFMPGLPEKFVKAE